MTADWKNKKVAIYLRRSKGDTGDTESQLGRIEPLIRALEKAKKNQEGEPFNRWPSIQVYQGRRSFQILTGFGEVGRHIQRGRRRISV